LKLDSGASACYYSHEDNFCILVC